MDIFLRNNNVEFENNKIKIAENIKRVKIDIGLSYNAPQSQVWLKKEKDLLVFGFEPYPENIKSIIIGAKKRKSSHGEPLNIKYIKNNHFKIISCALSNIEETRQMKFYITQKDSGCSSLFIPKIEYVGPIKNIINVPVFSLKHFFDLFPWDKIPIIEYIKIDAQGSDLNILKGAQKYLTEKVVYITAEADGFQYNGAEDDNVKSIIKYMENIGFDYVNHKNTNDPTFLNKKFLHKKNIYIKQR